MRRRIATRIRQRELMLGAIMFAAGTLAGAVLSGATAATTPQYRIVGDRAALSEPTDVATIPFPASPTAAPDLTGAALTTAVDPAFARSMVWSGVLAIILSAAGLVMVGRRRRLW